MRRALAFIGGVVLLSVIAVRAAEAPKVTVVNKGFPGRNSRDALRLMDTEIIALKPQHVVVYFGMNDAMNSGNLLPLADYEAHLRTMVKKLTDSGVKSVALVTINPVIEEYVRARHPKHPQKENLQACLASYDQAVRKVAGENALPLIDLRQLVEKNGGSVISDTCLIRCEKNGGGKDGVHLTPAAYLLLGQRAFEVVGGRVKGGDTVVCFGDSITFGAGVKGAGTVAGETYPAALQRCFDQRK
jgi:lysophospholipase L1-like esterase